MANKGGVQCRGLNILTQFTELVKPSSNQVLNDVITDR